MKLNKIQEQVKNIILKNYESGFKSTFFSLPVGSGKTITSLIALQQMVEKFNIHSVAYIVSSTALKNQVSHMIDISIDIKSKIKVYTYNELSNKIANNTIFQKEFQVLIFDDVIEYNQHIIEKIYKFFDGFKIGYSVYDLPKNFSAFQPSEEGFIYKYSLEDSIIDGSFLNSQKKLYSNFFTNINSQISNIKLGTDWTTELKQNIFRQLELLKIENADYLEAQDLFLSGKINAFEIIEFSKRKEQLKEFKRLLDDNDYFNKKIENNREEAVWQKYFELNPWIFGFGLSYIFNAPLEGEKLEQTVAGHSIKGHGKRADALLKTTGIIQSLCFGEIKTHRKEILKKTKLAYRSESWAISDEIAGGIAQIHKTIQLSLQNISTKLQVKDKDGYNVKNPIYLYKPKSFLLIGSLKEFINENGDIQEEKFSSFELFRRSINDIEIITFDELFERANAIINMLKKDVVNKG